MVWASITLTASGVRSRSSSPKPDTALVAGVVRVDTVTVPRVGASDAVAVAVDWPQACGATVKTHSAAAWANTERENETGMCVWCAMSYVVKTSMAGRLANAV